MTIDKFLRAILTVNSSLLSKIEQGTYWQLQTEKNDGQQEEGRQAMGDKGGKKDKEKGQKQKVEKHKQKSEKKLDKQPKRTS